MKIRPQLVHVYSAGALAIAVAALVLITGFAAQRENSQSLATQQVIARFDSQDAYDYLKGQTRQMVYWQDAFDNIVRRWNQEWVAYQFGPYQDTMGNHHVAIVGPDRKVRFLHGTQFDRSFTPEAFRRAKGLDALLDATRASGLRKPPPIPQGIIVVGDKPYFAVAAYITPEEKNDLALAQREPYAALFMKPVTVSQYSGFAAGFEAENVRITIADTVAPGEARYDLNDAKGTPVAHVQWTPILPGDHFLRSITLPLAIVLLILTLIQSLIASRWLKLQHRLIRAEAESSAAREQSRLKSVFLGTISHELRTPLNAIIGYSDVLCCQLFGPLGAPRNLEYAKDIRASGRKLLDAVNDLIEIARIEARDTGHEDDVFDVEAAVRQAILTLKPATESKNIKMAMKAEGEPAWCRGSHISLSQALQRILDNAVRHSPAGSAVNVSVERDGDDVVIAVTDHGDGIPQERLEDLCRPFGHPDNHLISRGNKGLGFGIPIARGLVELMGGRFEIESELGSGTTVRLKLPAQAPRAEPAIPPAGSEPASGVIWTGRGREFVARRVASGR